MRHKHGLPWNMVRKLKNGENERQTLYDLEYGEKSDKEKTENSHGRTWNMTRSSEKREK